VSQANFTSVNIFNSDCLMTPHRCFISDNQKHSCILHSFRDIKPRLFRGHDLDRLGHVTNELTWP